MKEEKRMPVMRLRELRKAAGLTVPQLAAAVGVTAAEVVAWECETYLPKTRLLPALAKVLGCGIGDLFVGEEIKEI